MSLKIALCGVVLCTMSVFNLALARNDNPKTESNAAVATHASGDDSAMRLEGEKRFRANCTRCHAAPPKFPPRMMGTIVRHMRVRAMLTDEDTRLILRYMTQ